MSHRQFFIRCDSRVKLQCKSTDRDHYMKVLVFMGEIARGSLSKKSWVRCEAVEGAVGLQSKLRTPKGVTQTAKLR